MTDSDFDSGRVKAFREARGWSQQQLAAEIGVDQATISRIENGIEPRRPIWILLSRMMEEAGVPSTSTSSVEAAE